MQLILVCVQMHQNLGTENLFSCHNATKNDKIGLTFVMQNIVSCFRHEMWAGHVLSWDSPIHYNICSIPRSVRCSVLRSTSRYILLGQRAPMWQNTGHGGGSISCLKHKLCIYCRFIWAIAHWEGSISHGIKKQTKKKMTFYSPERRHRSLV